MHCSIWFIRVWVCRLAVAAGGGIFTLFHCIVLFWFCVHLIGCDACQTAETHTPNHFPAFSRFMKTNMNGIVSSFAVDAPHTCTQNNARWRRTIICAATLLEGCSENRTRVIDTQMSFMDGEKESEIEKGAAMYWICCVGRVNGSSFQYQDNFHKFFCLSKWK